ncbi:MAG TPA: dihydrolipoyl dehydrogenase [Candidatus Marinimicrobia bacterium]|nr:dihydrolipoyl dehydrogenase [Candidatus Neomarinimicrobiota bacterium]HRU92617.1 dihydrolipoyl dehydrogenase [Candidatus Neomarinimicrobiota bacterium]
MDNFDLIVIGSGPGGYVAAIRAAQLGMNAAIVEKAELGGICLNWGCIPTKALLKNAEVWQSLNSLNEFGITIAQPQFDFTKVIRRSREVAARLSKGVEFLFQKNKVAVVKGSARLLDRQTVEVVNPDDNVTVGLKAQNIIIATGARQRSIPNVAIDGKRVISSREAMILPQIPKSIIVIGAGAIGVEFAYLFNAFGAEVNLVEMLPQILPIEDEEIAKELSRSFRKRQIGIHISTKVKSVQTKGDSVEVALESDGKPRTLVADYALVATGVQPNSENLGLEELGIITEKGWIKVDEHLRTNVPNIYAIGDVIGNPCLAHVASAEGKHAVEFIAGKNPAPVNYAAIPSCTYCRPQVASVGLTEKKAAELGYELKIGHFMFRANGKAVASGESDGFVKVIFDGTTQKLIGAHIIGAEATELLPELVLAIDRELTYDELKDSIHAHPTLSEALIEAIHDAFGESVHQ